MGLLRAIQSIFHDDWCKKCKTPMEVRARKLYTLPMTVGNYCAHKDAAYYKQNLRPVADRSRILPGIYACEVIAYRCPECGHSAVKLLIYLPVRDQNQQEDVYLFENGEMDDFLRRS